MRKSQVECIQGRYSTRLCPYKKKKKISVMLGVPPNLNSLQMCEMKPSG